MMYAIYAIVCVVIGALFAVVFFLKRMIKSRGSQHNISLERKALGELTRSEERLDAEPESWNGKHRVSRYYKRLKVVMETYMLDKYGVIVDETLTPSIEQKLLEDRGAPGSDIGELKRLFEELENMKNEKQDVSPLHALYKDVIEFFKKRAGEDVLWRAG